MLPARGERAEPYWTREAVVADWSMMLGEWDADVAAGAIPTPQKLGKAAYRAIDEIVIGTAAAMFANSVPVNATLAGLREVLEGALFLLPEPLRRGIHLEAVVRNALHDHDVEQARQSRYGVWIGNVVDSMAGRPEP